MTPQQSTSSSTREERGDVSFALIGTSAIADSFADAAAHVEGARAAVAISRSAERADEFAARHPGMTGSADRAAVLADESIDAVYVASPTTMHEADVLEALEAGKHVLCEKPIALDLASFDRMHDLAGERGLVLMEAARAVHDPAYRTIADALPRLGRIWHARLEKCQYSSRYDAVRAGEHRRAFDPRFGHSALSDIGIYTVLPAIQLFGAPDSSWATSQRLPAGDEGAFDASGLVVLEYGGDEPKSVSCRYSKVTGTSVPSVIEGEDGVLEIDELSEPGRIVLRDRATGEAEVLLDQPARSVSESMRDEIRDFADLVRSGSVEHPYASISRGAVEVMAQAYAR